MAFAFYDFETTGISAAFDQPLQYAAILTDDDFNELEQVNIRCRLAPHILPSPMATAITGVMPDQMQAADLPDRLEFAATLRDLIQRWSPACWSGYNTIRFDEEILRQTFYQTLQPEIYQTQLNGNQRFDIMRAVYAVAALAPETLIWPEDEPGKPIYKLDRLAPANGFHGHNAHDALGDVFATIHIAKLIRDRAPEIWAQLLANRDKDDVKARLLMGRPMQLVERNFGPVRTYTGCFCGFQDGYPNRVGFFDLEASDPAALSEADDDALFAAVDTPPQLIRTLAINKDPSLFECSHASPDVLDRAAHLASRPAFRERVGRALAQRYAGRDEPGEVEQQIYSGFYSAAVKAQLVQFQAADWPARKAMLEDFTDPRLRRLGLRLVMEGAPHLFTSSHLARAAEALASRWQAEPSRDRWTTFEDVHKDLEKIAELSLMPDPDMAHLQAFYRDRQSKVEMGIWPVCLVCG